MIFDPAVEVEISNYIQIYKEIGADKHWQVNEFITKNSLWDDFSKIRSINNHGLGKENILGIEPKYYKEICMRLGLRQGPGAALRGSKRY